MTTATSGAIFEIKVDGVVRTHRDVRQTAIEAVRLGWSHWLRGLLDALAVFERRSSAGLLMS